MLRKIFTTRATYFINRDRERVQYKMVVVETLTESTRDKDREQLSVEEEYILF